MAAVAKHIRNSSANVRAPRWCKVWSGLLAICLPVLLVLPTAPFVRKAAAAETRLVVAGSGTNLPVIWLLAQAFQHSHPRDNIYIPASIGSGGAIRAAARGMVDIGLISRDLQGTERGLGLTVAPYARTAAVVAVHPSVKENDITFDEINAIYQGAKGRWQDGNKIVVLTREPEDSTIVLMEKKIPGFKDIYERSQRASRWKTTQTDQEMNEALVATPYAIGLSDFGAITADKLPIKALRVNGIAPTPENIRNGSYPFIKPLSFVYRKENLSPAARAFLEFVGSSHGQKILKAYGYQPIKPVIAEKHH